ncbi:MAG: hypothetical protein AAF125_26555, partial [Chloroflexota bacterium]
MFVYNSLFFDNEADDGGAIFSNNNPVTVRNSAFVENTAFLPYPGYPFSGFGEGGAIYVKFGGSSLDLECATFVGNDAERRGGAIASLGGAVNVDRANFVTNTADQFAGGIYISDDTATIEGTWWDPLPGQSGNTNGITTFYITLDNPLSPPSPTYPLDCPVPPIGGAASDQQLAMTVPQATGSDSVLVSPTSPEPFIYDLPAQNTIWRAANGNPIPNRNSDAFQFLLSGTMTVPESGAYQFDVGGMTLYQGARAWLWTDDNPTKIYDTWDPSQGIPVGIPPSVSLTAGTPYRVWIAVYNGAALNSLPNDHAVTFDVRLNGTDVTYELEAAPPSTGIFTNPPNVQSAQQSNNTVFTNVAGFCGGGPIIAAAAIQPDIQV